MASEIRELRIKARKLGASNVREMSRSELVEYIKDNSNGNGSKGKKSGKAAVKAAKAVKKRGPGRPRKVEVDEEDEAPKRRGRPKGSTNKKAAKRGRPAKTENKKGKAKPARKSSGGPGRPAGSGPGTRVLLADRINWNKNFDFREGSIQAYILNEIRKAAKKESDTSEIRAIVFDKLVDKINERDELTFMNRETGKPHKGEKAEQRLKYYISRTMFDYAVNTGQHEGAGDSAASQPRGNGATVTKKGAAKRGRPRKVVDEDDEEDDDEDEDEAPRRRGRPKGSTNKKRGPGRPKGSGKKSKTTSSTKATKRGPGRPKGSKSKTRRSSK